MQIRRARGDGQDRKRVNQVFEPFAMAGDTRQFPFHDTPDRPGEAQAQSGTETMMSPARQRRFWHASTGTPCNFLRGCLEVAESTAPTHKSARPAGASS